MKRIVITISEQERRLLERISALEHRAPRDQLRFLIWQEGQRRHLLPAEVTTQQDATPREANYAAAS